MESERVQNSNMTTSTVLLNISRFLIFLSIHKMIGIVVYQVIRAVVIGTVTSKFELHIIFSVIGYQLLLVEAIMSFNKESHWIKSFPRNVVRVVHLVFAITGGLFAIVGASLIMSLRPQHFDTAHSICGFIAMLLSCLSMIHGCLTYFSSKLRNIMTPATIKAVHTVNGIFAIIMGLTTLCIGINKPIFLILVGFNQDLVNTLTAFIVLILLYILWHPIYSLFGYAQNMRSTEL